MQILHPCFYELPRKKLKAYLQDQTCSNPSHYTEYCCIAASIIGLTQSAMISIGQIYFINFIYTLGVNEIRTGSKVIRQYTDQFGTDSIVIICTECVLFGKLAWFKKCSYMWSLFGQNIKHVFIKHSEVETLTCFIILMFSISFFKCSLHCSLLMKFLLFFLH